jgi:hypothetical protein
MKPEQLLEFCDRYNGVLFADWQYNDNDGRLVLYEIGDFQDSFARYSPSAIADMTEEELLADILGKISELNDNTKL